MNVSSRYSQSLFFTYLHIVQVYLETINIHNIFVKVNLAAICPSSQDGIIPQAIVLRTYLQTPVTTRRTFILRVLLTLKCRSSKPSSAETMRNILSFVLCKLRHILLYHQQHLFAVAPLRSSPVFLFPPLLLSPSSSSSSLSPNGRIVPALCSFTDSTNMIATSFRRV